MTADDAKRHLPIVTALAEGKVIQYRCKDVTEWTDTKDPLFCSDVEYRVKPEPEPAREVWVLAVMNSSFKCFGDVFHNWTVHPTKRLAEAYRDEVWGTTPGIYTEIISFKEVMP